MLDPYMGGGTSIVEGFARGRLAIGSDINELSHFVTKTKTTLLSSRALARIQAWFAKFGAGANFRAVAIASRRGDECRNLDSPATRPIRKVTRNLLASLDVLPRRAERNFARCAILRSAQWALDNKRDIPTLSAYRERLQANADSMIVGMFELSALALDYAKDGLTPRLATAAAQDQRALQELCDGRLVDLVVTSPPYPGVHILYHRWQIRGRRETDAPYWISQTRDGKGSAYYNFADRKSLSQDRFFDTYSSGLRAIRSVMKPGATLVQMVACRDPLTQLPRLLHAIQQAGFRSIQCTGSDELFWREVPGRKWHAALKGEIATAREVVLIHEAQ